MLDSIVLDTNELTNINDAVLACSQSKKSKITLSNNQFIKIMNKKPNKIRKKAI